MADLNRLPATPAVRQPRGAVKLNGTVVSAWISWSVNNNRFRAADTFEVTFAASDLPATLGASWFSTQTSILVELFATASPVDPSAYVPVAADRLIYGQTDDIKYNPAEGTIELTGRDLTARLIDTKTSENHQNQTASQVATLLAVREGLKPVVTPTTTRIGLYYAQDHTDINQQQSEWDLLCRIADFEGFDVFVVGDELHFQPRDEAFGDSYALVWAPPTDDQAYPSVNAVDLDFSRSLTIAKGVTVEVRSWNSKQKKGFTASWPKATKTAKPGASSDRTLRYHYSYPGLTQDQASLKAQQKYNEIIRHMVSLSANLPADNILDCTKTITVRGTGTAWDQTYYPDSVTRSMSMGEGYRMAVTAKNISEATEGGKSE